MIVKTYSIAEVAADICGDSMADPVLWMRRQILAGRFTARKVGRHWRMTTGDIDNALEVMANRTESPAAPEPVAEPISIARPSAASMRRRMAVAQ